MNDEALNLLQEIGQQLDRRTFPVVWDGGLVLPSKTPVSSYILGEEKHNESSRNATQGSAAFSWPGAEGWSRSAGGCGAAHGCGPSGSTAPLARVVPSADLPEGVGSLIAAYPKTEVWEQTDGFWIRTESSLLPGLGRTAVFLIAVIPDWRLVLAWGFWQAGTVGTAWIGPRHTNFADGSICAFDEQDQTWSFGDSLVNLVDLYSVWAVRQLHLETFGWWPGPQASAYAYDRLMDFADREHCGCGVQGKRYSECCKPKDAAGTRLGDAMHFLYRTNAAPRKLPQALVSFLHNKNAPPDLRLLYRSIVEAHGWL